MDSRFNEPRQDLPTPFTPSGRPLPGWGQTLRKLHRQSAALMFAAFTGLALDGCQAAVPSTTNLVATTSAPGPFRAALQVALQHLDALPHPASAPFHLVAFSGTGLDENGNSTPAVGSGWSFTFSRYADVAPTASYETVTIAIPGVGTTSVSDTVSQDADLSPIENWDAGTDPASPDSKEFLAPLKAKNLATAGASIVLKAGVVTITANGRSTSYNTVDGTFAAVN